jgi:hypothetical protein
MPEEDHKKCHRRKEGSKYGATWELLAIAVMKSEI